MVTDATAARISAVVAVVQRLQDGGGYDRLISKKEAMDEVSRIHMVPVRSASVYIEAAVDHGHLVKLKPSHLWGIIPENDVTLPPLYVGRRDRREVLPGHRISREPTVGTGPGPLLLVATPKHVAYLAQKIRNEEKEAQNAKRLAHEADVQRMQSEWLAEAVERDAELVALADAFRTAMGDDAEVAVIPQETIPDSVTMVIRTAGGPKARAKMRKFLRAGLKGLIEEEESAQS